MTIMEAVEQYGILPTLGIGILIVLLFVLVFRFAFGGGKASAGSADKNVNIPVSGQTVSPVRTAAITAAIAAAVNEYQKDNS
jgi:Na+-transporting methylmalonyl-CoA/oxaloacetate decarboxylase gamma subunit